MDDIWNMNEFLDVAPERVVKRFWEDDDQIRGKSLRAFSLESGLVDEGLSLYVEPLQGAFRDKTSWDHDIQQRAAFAMLMHALNSFLAWRQLLCHGYLAEASLCSRSIFEALSQALAFSVDEDLAREFFSGATIKPKHIQMKVSEAVASATTTEREVFKQLKRSYSRLSQRAHPTLKSFALRTLSVTHGEFEPKEAVPEYVVIGGIMNDRLGRLVWIGLARDIGRWLPWVRQLIKEGTGAWNLDYTAYHEKTEDLYAQVIAEIPGAEKW